MKSFKMNMCQRKLFKIGLSRKKQILINNFLLKDALRIINLKNLYQFLSKE